MFKKILIANRGAIACRIIRTLNKMNIQSVAIYAEADRDSLHVEQASEAYSLGEGSATQTYLDKQKIIAIARESGAEAIHPGYGFLSENTEFVSLCKDSNIKFIGPTPENMAAFSLKHTARDLAEKLEVPLVPGSGLIKDVETAVEEAAKITYPVILKSSAGGGGIGMAICRDKQELQDNFDSVVRLSKNNFSDSRVFLEKYIEHARHIEVQIFGDGQGTAINLGERDCSLQRRNQKVIEEAPAPNLRDEVRQALFATAETLASGINYENAGTVEFIFDAATENFYFLEVNTRLQVEHGVTEEVYSVDIVRWMVEQAYSPIQDLKQRRKNLTAKGHAIQARIYAENPSNNFQPSAGLLTQVSWGESNPALRLDTWVETGTEVSPFFDPMLAKAIYWGETRTSAIEGLNTSLKAMTLYGIETNLRYANQLLEDKCFQDAQMYTRYLEGIAAQSDTIEVLKPGTMTSIQDYPGRVGYWEVGVPPSGPYDNYSFSLGNTLLENESHCAGLEITMTGPSLKFHTQTQVCITGAEISVLLDEEKRQCWEVININAGQTLKIGAIGKQGARAYLLVKGGIDCPEYLDSKSTFTLGQFGGHAGRALKTGDFLKITANKNIINANSVSTHLRPRIQNHWVLNVVYGPHGAPDFFTQDDINTFFSTDWEVHYNSSRTGIRLVGPKPTWARETGGEAGMHPSNIHDNAYAFGTIDFTGDMPVILGPDGPSLGGFVCPATVISADLWKLGQLRAGDKIRFNCVTIDSAVEFKQLRSADIEKAPANALLDTVKPESCVLKTVAFKNISVTIRAAGDEFILVEFGENILDLRLRIYVYALREEMQSSLNQGIVDLTPGVRSLQIHYTPSSIPLEKLLSLLEQSLENIADSDDVKIPTRVVHLPLSWDDDACKLAIEKYTQSVRKDAPWCPSNIEFIRRINGLQTVDEVKDVVFNASYVVMGLGDVYLGAPVATPFDPRHRLVTTKYNPARTWTAENSVGIGGAYMCVYGMEGPGGYQFVGRTIQMWNRYHKTQDFEQPWLLRFFDQIKFYPVKPDELLELRKQFPKGKFKLKIEEDEFSLKEYESFLAQNQQGIAQFQEVRQKAFDEELQRWRDSGQFHFDSSQEMSDTEDEIPENTSAIESHVAGNVWKLLVKEGDVVEEGQAILILESMKMEIEICTDTAGKVSKLLKSEGQIVSSGQALAYIEETK